VLRQAGARGAGELISRPESYQHQLARMMFVGLR
jgi:hypothetical protein